MSLTILRLRKPSDIPVEAECLVPERLAGLVPEAAGRLLVWVGNRQEPLGEHAEVLTEERDGPMVLRLVGDFGHVKWIGKGMTSGRIEIHGRAGMHLGAYMAGGEIDCQGDAGDWAGAMMRGGLLRIRGNAGHLVGAGYRGEPVGMTDGLILVHGNAGNEVGAAMGRGLIAVLGSMGDAAGVGMHAGTILCGGALGIRPGIAMQRGSIIGLGPVELLPTFPYSCTYRPPYLGLLRQKLASLGADQPLDGEFRLYTGDMAIHGKGEVLVWTGPSA